MNVIEIGGFGRELVVERHQTAPTQLITWETPSAGDFILDIGKFSVVYSNLNTREGGQHAFRHAHRVLATALVVSLALLASAEAVRAFLTYGGEVLLGPR